jgi:hypothetical protein
MNESILSVNEIKNITHLIGAGNPFIKVEKGQIHALLYIPDKKSILKLYLSYLFLL